MMVIYQQTDRIMLKVMLDESATGYYSAAVTCAGIFGFVYAAIIDSMRPEILKSKKSSEEQYEKSISFYESEITRKNAEIEILKKSLV